MKIYDRDRSYAEVGRANADRQTDSKSKEFQNQIADAQNQLKDLAADKELGEDEKEKKRKEIQQQIKELNSRLRQHQIQMQKEEREKRANVAVTDEKQGSGIKEETKETSVNAQTSVKAILSANTAIDHARKHGNMNLEMEGRVRVLQNEIKQDIQYGKNTEQKQKELEKLEKKAVKVKGAKMSYLASASREMKRAAETEKEADRTFKKKKQAEFVNPAAAPGNFSANRKTNIYIQGNMFSHVDFHF